MKSVANKVTAIISAVMVLGFIVFSVILYNQNMSNLSGIFRNGKSEALNSVALYVDNYIGSRLEAVKNFGSEFKDNIDDEFATKKLKDVFEHTPFDALYIGYASDGRLIKTDDISKNTPFTLNVEKNNFDSRTRAWFKGALSNGGSTGISKPYNDITTKNLTISFFTPIKIGGKIEAVASSNVFLNTFQDDIAKLKVGDSRTIVVDEFGNVVAHSDKSKIMSDDKEYLQVVSKLVASAKTKEVTFYEVEGEQREAICAQNDSIGWTTCVVSPLKIIDSILSESLIFQSIFSAVFVIFIIIVLIYVIKFQLRPINSIKDGLTSFFAFINHKSQDAPFIEIKSKDEFGQMASEINENIKHTKENLAQDSVAVQESMQKAKDVENGDLKARIEANPSSPELSKLKDVLNTMLGVLEQKVGSDINAIESVFNSYTAHDFTPRIDKASGKVEVITNTVGNKICGMLNENLSNAEALSLKSDNLRNLMNELNASAKSQTDSLSASAAAIEQMSSSMSAISERAGEVLKQSNDIREVVNVIGDIADQTNLLALNASIEAARAGEHGRGFAVVADEVGNLADKVQKSLSEISANVNILSQGINEMSGSIEEQTKAVSEINSAVANVEQITNKTLNIVGDAQNIASEVDNMAKSITSDVKKNKF